MGVNEFDVDYLKFVIYSDDELVVVVFYVEYYMIVCYEICVCIMLVYVVWCVLYGVFDFVVLGFEYCF